MLPVSEIFGPSIQGEGPYSGRISCFIRFGGCNFSCQGYGVEYKTPSGEIKRGCDSYYSVDTAFRQNWNKLSFTDIINEIKNKIMTFDYDTKSIQKPDIVITGGEPLIFWENSDFQSLIEYFITNDYRVIIETNASIDIKIKKKYQRKIIFSMSIKLSNSGESLNKRVNYYSIYSILENTKKCYFKFVVDNNQELVNEIKEIISKITSKYNEFFTNADLANSIYIMPKGFNQEELNKNSLFCVETAIKEGWRYSDRLHIRIWDTKKGV